MAKQLLCPDTQLMTALLPGGSLCIRYTAFSLQSHACCGRNVHPPTTTKLSDCTVIPDQDPQGSP